MIYAVKKTGESNERLISRFKKTVQRSRILMEAKKHQYHSRKPGVKRTRQAAVMRTFYRKKREMDQLAS